MKVAKLSSAPSGAAGRKNIKILQQHTVIPSQLDSSFEIINGRLEDIRPINSRRQQAPTIVTSTPMQQAPTIVTSTPLMDEEKYDDIGSDFESDGDGEEPQEAEVDASFTSEVCDQLNENYQRYMKPLQDFIHSTKPLLQEIPTRRSKLERKKQRCLKKLKTIQEMLDFLDVTEKVHEVV